MKKIFLTLAVALVAGAAAYAQTQRTSRTNTRTHDRSETIDGNTTPVVPQNRNPARADKMNPQTDVDRNNTNSNTNTTTPNNGATHPANGRSTGGTNTNGGTGTNGANIHSNNPR